MRKLILLFSICSIALVSFSQKKPLDHSVYDSWQSIGEKLISNDGKWVVYTINVQEGDNDLVIQSSDLKYKKIIPRGYNALITENNRFVICKIKPFYKETREARIKKKRPEEMPKDSLAILQLGQDETWKTAKVKTYKTPSKGNDWLAYHLEKPLDNTLAGKAARNESNAGKRLSDSLNHIIDSLNNVIQNIPRKKGRKKDDDDMNVYGESAFEDVQDADGDETPAASAESGTDLVLRQLSTSQEKIFNNVVEYYFNKTGEKLLFKLSKNPKDSLSKPAIVLFDLGKMRADTLSRGGNDFRNFAISDDGEQVAFTAERDAKPKELLKYYKLWYYKKGMDTAQAIADRFSVGMQLGMTVSENGNLSFSKTGKRLFFGTAAVQPPRDTTLVDFEHPKVDIWHYNDDYLQSVQLFRLQNDLKQNFLAVYDVESASIKQLANLEIPQVISTNDGDGDTFVGITDMGKRIESQWMGGTKKDVYAIDVKTGIKKLVKENLDGQATPSATGKYILLYDRKARNYFVWDGNALTNLTDKIKSPLWNEATEVPEDPGPYGLAGWQEGDAAVYVYDKYDIWKVDPTGKAPAINITNGRKNQLISRYIQTDPDDRTIKADKPMMLRVFSDIDKNSAIQLFDANGKQTLQTIKNGLAVGIPLKAKNADAWIGTKESFIAPPDIYFTSFVNNLSTADVYNEEKLSAINQQQANYLWGTAELVKWKAYNGKEATGIVYKPENFDPKKKYPMIAYFYETLSDNLNTYHAPAPIRSAINIPFYVSRGYVIFLPDIHYGTGHPGQDAYDYVVSGARALVKKGFVDSTAMAIQGHSWGGYQVAQIITMTSLFKAAWAGAPVANMTSAYGGIRWESGVNRQFQYEHSQSRIGATLWEKPQLYIDNSPLFHLDKVTTPLVIMSNDADGAVPWYQGIEMFTAMRRLGKKVWFFNYNGEGHGLTQRQDMRDYQIRMQQFFDWILKGETPTKWITDGVPAVKKGKDWGLE